MIFVQLLANGLVAGCAYALIAPGVGLDYNTTRIFHLAHRAVHVLSAYNSAFTHWPWPLRVAVPSPSWWRLAATRWFRVTRIGPGLALALADTRLHRPR